MLKFLLLIPLLWTFDLIVAQTSYPKGIYWSRADLKDMFPSQEVELLVEERSGPDMFMRGGNLYRLESAGSDLSETELKEEIWAYSDGKELYINGSKLNIGHWYTKVEHEGNYLLVQVNSLVVSVQPNTPQNEGTAVTFSKTYSTPNYSVMAIDPDDLSVILLNKKELKKWLAETPNLLKEYENQKLNNKVEIILKYASQRNEITDF